MFLEIWSLLKALPRVRLLAALSVAVGRQDVELGAHRHVSEHVLPVPQVVVEIQEGVFDAFPDFFANFRLPFHVLKARLVVERLARVIGSVEVSLAL